MVFFQVILTCIAFAGNSVLCKLVLKGELLGPQEFTTIRLGSGALALALCFDFFIRLSSSQHRHWCIDSIWNSSNHLSRLGSLSRQAIPNL